MPVAPSDPQPRRNVELCALTGDPQSQASVVERVFETLEAFGPGDCLSLAELSRRTGIPKSSMHRLLGQLSDRQVLVRVGSKYRLGLALFELGTRASLASVRLDLAMPVLRRLAERAQATVHLGVLEGPDVLYLAKVDYEGVRTPTYPGLRLPGHCSALGKVLLAAVPDEELRHTLIRPLRKRTPYTVSAPSVLYQQVARTREQGYAVEIEEGQLGTACIAAPIAGGPGVARAAVSLTMKSSRLATEEAHRSFGSLVAEAAVVLVGTLQPAGAETPTPRRVTTA